VVVGLAVSALAITLLVQQIQLDKVVQVLGTARPLWVIVLVVTVVLAILCRAARWQVFFLPHLKVPFPPLYGTLAISYMASTFLPLRAGEFVRAVFLSSRESIAIPLVIGTILLEKLFDFLAIGVMLAILLLMAPPQLPAAATVVGTTILTVIVVGFGWVVALAVWREPTLRFVRFFQDSLPFRAGERLRLEAMARQFAEGTDSLRVWRLWIPLLAWTALTWLCSLVSTWAGLEALDVHPGIAAVLFVLVLTSSGQAVPSSPGYVGVFHAAATAALVAFGVDPATALACAILLHAFTYGTLVVLGLIALWTGGYSFSDLRIGLSGRSNTTARTEPLSLAPDA
jgi:uncharacterized protein (TIRG00374 family)